MPSDARRGRISKRGSGLQGIWKDSAARSKILAELAAIRYLPVLCIIVTLCVVSISPRIVIHASHDLSSMISFNIASSWERIYTYDSFIQG